MNLSFNLKCICLIPKLFFNYDNFMKIIYVGGFELPDKNAAAQRVMANAKLLREIGNEVLFIGISKTMDDTAALVDGFVSHTIPYPTNTKQWMHQICTFIDTKVIIDAKPDYVILYNFPAIASLRILKACHKNGIKVVQDLTEWESIKGWTPANIMRKIDINLRMYYCTKKMDGVIAISRYLYDYYKRFTNTILVPPTVDLSAEKWNRNRELSVGDTIKLVYAGNAGFGVKDRLDLIIKSVVKFPKMRLDVIGMTKQQYTTGYGNFPTDCNNIFFHGRIPHSDAVKAVQGADFQFLIRDSNLKNNAGFPTKFVESLACCTPVIATLTSNVGDYLKDGVNGFIVNNACSIDDVLVKISNLSKRDIIMMKQCCKDCFSFDYHEYEIEFKQIFKQYSC